MHGWGEEELPQVPHHWDGLGNNIFKEKLKSELVMLESS